MCCRAVSLHTVNSLSSRRGDTNSKSPAATQFASPQLSTIVASPSPDKNAAGDDDDDVDAAQVKVSTVNYNNNIASSVMTWYAVGPVTA